MPEAGCMKCCGGEGPTVSVDGVARKVDIRAAVATAVRGVQP